MSKKDKLSLYANFDQIGGNYKNARKQYMQVETQANAILEENTKKEKLELEKAMKKYNKKVEKILKSEKFQSLENDAKKYSTEMSKNLLKARNAFNKVSQDILKREDWDNNKKNKKIQELYEIILNKFYDKEEMEKFKTMMGNIVVMVTNKKI